MQHGRLLNLAYLFTETCL